MPNNAPKGSAPEYTQDQLDTMLPEARKKVKAAQAKRLRQRERKRKLAKIEWAGKQVKDMEP